LLALAMLLLMLGLSPGVFIIARRIH
jgi:hypothetical protein